MGKTLCATFLLQHVLQYCYTFIIKHLREKEDKSRSSLNVLSSRGGLNICPCLSPNSGRWGWRWDCLGGVRDPLGVEVEADWQLADAHVALATTCSPPFTAWFSRSCTGWNYVFSSRDSSDFLLFSTVFHTSHIESWLKRFCANIFEFMEAELLSQNCWNCVVRPHSNFLLETLVGGREEGGKKSESQVF